MLKVSRNHQYSISLISLPSDLLAVIMNLLGLHGINLRAAHPCFLNLPLTEGVALALKVLQVGPSRPIKEHAQRRTTRACMQTRWDYFAYKASMAWREDWSLALTSLDAAPIRVLLDAWDAVPVGPFGFFGPVWIGGETATRLTKWIETRENFYIRPSAAYNGGTNYTSHVKVALFKTIEARMWDLIWGDDLERRMPDEEVVEVVKRILDTTPVRNDRCFHFTNKGWLKYTPLLLAAERHNLPLVKYLAQRGDTDLSAESRGGNNAYSICMHALMRSGKPEHAIVESQVLQFLYTECWCEPRPYKREGRG
jgi:hypothetical protein